MEIRKAQRAGYSTLVVSLPIKWVKESGVKHGDSLALIEEQDGSLKIVPQLGMRKREESICMVNADLCSEREMLAKILIGGYVVGHETIQVYSKRPLKSDQLAELRKASSRLIGMGMVEQTLNRVTLQSLVDPAKFPIYASIRRLHTIILAMFEGILHAISEMETKYLIEVVNMESDVDKLYRLTVRQLILAAKDREIMKQVGVENPLNIVGNRVVAKALEEIADHLEDIAANSLPTVIEENIETEILTKTSSLISLTKSVAERVIDSFFKKDIREASRASLSADSTMKECEEAVDQAVKAGDGELEISLTAASWNLVQIMKQYKTITGITINRSLEGSTEISSITAREE